MPQEVMNILKTFFFSGTKRHSRLTVTEIRIYMYKFNILQLYAKFFPLGKLKKKGQLLCSKYLNVFTLTVCLDQTLVVKDALLKSIAAVVTEGEEVFHLSSADNQTHGAFVLM